MSLVFNNFIQQFSVPAELPLREQPYSVEVGILAFLAFLAITFARQARPGIYFSLGMGMIKTSGVSSYVRDEFPLDGRGSILLLINYWISFSLIVYLWLGTIEPSDVELLIVSAIIPLALLIWHLGSMRLTGWITGESEVFREPLVMKLIGAQALGIVYFICAVFWVLNIELQQVVSDVILWAFILESFVRLVKSIAIVYRFRVSWYYIILYFCTLEILPLFVVLYFVSQNFNG